MLTSRVSVANDAGVDRAEPAFNDDSVVEGEPVVRGDLDANSDTDGMDDDALFAAKLEAMAEFAAGAGHEINNPLAAISGRAQLLLRNETDPERRRHLLTIGAQALRVRDMIGDAMLFARPPTPQPQLLSLTDVVDGVLTKFADDLAAKSQTVEGEREAGVPVFADETQLLIVISELLRNAARFAPQGSTIRVETRCVSASMSRLVVIDHGPGLSATDREHLFDPFYSGRQAGRGLGFGLPKCWRIVTLHGGTITANDTVDGQFAMQVDWPSTSEAIL